MDHSLILYKYLSPDRVKTLSDLELRFSPIRPVSILNDPFECCFELIPIPSERAESEADDGQVERYEVEIYIESNFYHAGLLCLSRNPLNKQMWGHYAVNNKGFVIGLHRDEGPFDGEVKISRQLCPLEMTGVPGFGTFRDVVYTDEAYKIKHGEVPVDAFFMKTTEWAHEEEVRIFRSLSDASTIVESEPRTVNLFRIPEKAIAEIIIGSACTPEVFEAARYLFLSGRVSGAKFFQVKLDIYKKSLSLVPIDFT